jgi:hypothetical protein
MEKYKTFLVKMVLDNLTNQEANKIMDICVTCRSCWDLQILLGLACILPLLEFVHVLVKFA